MKVLMFSKADNIFCDYAEYILKSNFKENEFISIRGSAGEPFCESRIPNKSDFIISFVSPWIIPRSVLEKATIAAINFHPGSPRYPGYGCYNFALYEQSKEYGVTVHHMKEKVDTGDIIMTSYFDIAPYESVETLKLKSMNHLLYCFEKILKYIREGKPLPDSGERWARKPYTRKEMLKLFEIDPTKHDKKEIQQRIRAATYPEHLGAYVNCAGHTFYYPYEKRPPIVS